MPNPCPKCGSPRSESAPAGLCPRCLMANALPSNADITYSFQPNDPAQVLDTLTKTVGPMPRVLLPDTAGSLDVSPLVKPSSSEMPAPADRSTRVQLLGEIARGGMGAVLKGRDADLGRDLAVKVLLETHKGNPDLVRRFVEEAQIGGQLQHPGIVPVYELGTFGDSRPYFTMKLVKGRTLADLLGSRKNPADELSRFLGIFEQIAQTVAYAHARGVIHRDLKPSNVMVGSFGEVQVMDWGLAKVLPKGGASDDAAAGKVDVHETVIATARSGGSDSDLSHAGSVMGTPSYMAPEQARGEIDRIDERADVFALGSILCEIFTGQPAFVGRNSGEILRKAAVGDLADALSRLETSEADPELITLTKDCLAREPEDRPIDAGAVADRLGAYLAGVQQRLQESERERAVAVVREAEQRKRRQVQLALAGAVMGLILTGGSFAWWQADQSSRRREIDLRRQLADEQRAAADTARLARNGEAVTSLLAQAEEALKAGSEEKAALVLGAALKRSTEGGAEIELSRLKRLEVDLALLRDLDAIDQFRWTPDESRYPAPTAVATRTREALKRFGADPDAVSVDDAATRVSVSVVQERIVAALDRLLMPIRLAEWDKIVAEDRRMFTPQMKNEVERMLPNTAEVLAVLKRVDADPYRDAVREAVVAEDRARFVGLAGQPQALEQPAGFVAFLGESQAVSVDRRRQLLREWVSRRPGDLGPLMSLGQSYQFNQKDGADERLRWFQAAVAAAPANAAAHLNLGVVLSDKGKQDEAIACLKKSIELDPRYAVAHLNLGIALSRKGKLDESIECDKKAIELDPKNAVAHTNLGTTLTRKGKLDEAIECYNKAIELDPKNAVAHTNLGLTLRGKTLLEEAITCFKKAIELGFTPARPLLAQTERMAGARDKLPSFLNGSYTPATTEERLGLAEWCRFKKFNDTATRIYHAAFAADVKMADDLEASHRYNAACHAVLAAAGQGEDAAKLDDAERTRLRKQAFDWLRADLAQWTKLLESGQPADRAKLRRMLQHWQTDTDLATIRDPEALAKLPEAERKEWQGLWAEVDALITRASAPKP